LFGALSAEVDGRSVPAVPGFKARSLFAYLLVHPGPHPRVRLAGLFWPDLPDTRARASLRVALFALRRTLEGVHGAGYLVTDRISAGIAADLPRDIDVERFDELLAGGDPAALAEAAALHRGPLLSDLPDEWVLAAQDDYRPSRADQPAQRGGPARRSTCRLPQVHRGALRRAQGRALPRLTTRPRRIRLIHRRR
jgi:DNA-binding SARP family transcriptional activator